MLKLYILATITKNGTVLFRKVIASKLTLNVTGDEMAYGKLAIQRSKKGNSAFRASD